jgi:hypothetical protein
MSAQAAMLTVCRKSYEVYAASGKARRAETELEWLRHFAACIIAGIPS